MSQKTARATQSFSAFRTLKKSLITTALTAGSVLSFATPSMADNWTNLETISGSFSTDVSTPHLTNITQYSDIVKARGDLDITENHTVNINQNSSNSLFAAYDIEGDPTHILGRLTANGRVLVIDQNGVFFGRNSVVDVGSIVATSGAVAADDLDDGKFDIQLTDQSGAIDLQGTMTVAEGGLAGFVAPTLSNSGVINAKLGTVAMASGKKATVDLYGDNLIEIVVDGALGNALIKNSGTINAQGGTVAMTAQAAKDAVDNVINMDGVVDVSSVSVQGGKIVLSGGKKGTVSVSGTLNADGKTGGGDIIVTGENVVATDAAVLSADATGQGNGGNVLVYGDQYAVFNGRINARGGQGGGNGGDVEISGGESVGYNGLVDLSAANGEAGTLLIDPKNLTIYNGVTTGIPDDVLSGGTSDVFINDLALANTLRLSNVNLWATETINTGSNIDLSTWSVGSNTGITGKDLTLAAPTINLLHDVILGKGRLRVADLAGGLGSTLGIINVPAGGIEVDVVNLDGVIFRRETLGGPLTIAGDSQISSQANTVNVLSNDALIQQGVYFANDAGGGTVNVGAGTYEEQITITKNLNLNGDGVGSSIITSPDNLRHTGTSPHGGRNYGIVYVKDASNVNIDGFTIDGSTNNQTVPFTTDDRFIGVIYQNAGGVFSNNHITNIKSVDTAPRSGFGFLAFDHITGVSNLTIEDNLIDGFQEYGIALANNQLKATVVGNTITGNKAGIAATQAGLYITSDADVTVGSLSDTADANIISGTDVGIESFKAKDNKIFGNTISNVHKGILLNESTGYDIAENTITGNSTIGIEVNLSSGTTITGDVISNFGTGIFVTDSNDVTIDSVQIDDILTSNAIHFLRGVDNTVINSLIGTTGGVQNITGAGIYADSSHGLTLQGNTIQNTKSTGTNIGSGIHLVNSNNALVGGASSAQANIISKTGWDGVRVNGGDNATVSFNDIDDVARTGVYGRNLTNSTINNNDIDGAGRFGVNLEGGNNVDVASNNIDDVVFNGINTTDANLIDISDNLIGLDGGVDTIKGNGIKIVRGSTVNVTDNEISNTKLNGVLAESVSLLSVLGNIINDVKEHGVNIVLSNAAQVKGNEIGLTGGLENIGKDGIHLVDSDNSVIQSNTISNTKLPPLGVFNYNLGNGIQVVSSDGVLIGGFDKGEGNTISNTGWDGIRIIDSNDADIVGNTMNDVGRTGVFARNTDTLLVQGNFVDGGSRFGVNVESSEDVSVLSNTIKNMGLNGIMGVNIDSATIDGNTIESVLGNGIRLNESEGGIEISNNSITSSGLNGIRLFNVYDYINIYDNTISDSSQNGILVDNNDDDLSIYDNTIEDSGVDGIHVSNGWYVSISENTISDSGDDGIEVISASMVDISGNIISNVGLGPVDMYGGDAIHVQDVFGDIYVVPSFVAFESLDDEDYMEFYSVNITNNIINMDFISGEGEEDGFYVPSETASSQDDGIQVLFSGNTLIENNLVANSGGEEGGADFGADGINVVTGYFGDDDYYYEGDYKVAFFPIFGGFSPVKVDVLNNVVLNSQDDGIEVVGANDVLIDANTVTNAGDNGITVEGFGISWLGETEEEGIIEDDLVSESLLRPSFFYRDWPYYTVDISNNTVDTTDTGIRTDGFDEAYIFSNDVTNTNGIGIYVHGYKNGFTSLYDNVLDGFDVGMQFESGVIDLQGESNTISNGRVGLLFRPYEYDEISVITLSFPSFVYEDIFPYPYSFGTGFSDLSLTEDDSIETSTPFPTTPPTDFAGTIGEQVFENIDESYVELDNFAFFQEGLPLWLNGLNSSYDGLVPADTSGILTAAQFANLESKFLHFTDGRDVGIFFFGLAPDVTPDIDESLLFREFPFFIGDITGLNIRILGLPSTGFGGGTIGGGPTPPTTPAGLNAIGPFAGGNTPEDLNQLETAAGGEDEGTNLNAINTQAGGDNTACWGDALTSAGNGQVVDVVYSGAIADDLDTAATCSTGL